MTGPVTSPQLTPTPAPTGALRRRPRVSYQWMVGNWRTGAEEEITHAASRTITARLDDPSDASFTIFGKSTQTPLIQELISDLWIYRNGYPLYRGRVLDSSDDITETTHVSRFTTKDYRAVLDGRLVPSEDGVNTPVYNVIPDGKEQGDIIWDDLITATQDQLGGNLGITKGIWPDTGVTRDGIIFEDGDRIWEQIRTLSMMERGFNFDIDHLLRANLYYPYRGSDKGSVLDFGGTVRSVTRSTNVGTYANALRLNGGHTVDYTIGPFTSTQVVGDLADASLFPEGRWEQAASDTSVYELAAVQALAEQTLIQVASTTPTYQFTLQAGAWGGPDHIWLGDTVTYTVRSGRLDVRNESGVVREISISLDQNDVETVTITTGKPVASLTRAVRELARRVAYLSKH